MIEQDTIRLLRECDAGIKMGILSIGEVLEYVRADGLRERLANSKSAHEKLEREMEGLLNRYHDEGKEPDRMAKGMSWLKTNVKLAMQEPDAAAADLVTDGCNMGVKLLYRYLNQYKAADENSKDIVKRLIRLEENLAADLRPFL